MKSVRSRFCLTLLSLAVKLAPKKSRARDAAVQALNFYWGGTLYN